jgi:hypothetical protein
VKKIILTHISNFEAQRLKIFITKLFQIERYSTDNVTK